MFAHIEALMRGSSVRNTTGHFILPRVVAARASAACMADALTNCTMPCSPQTMSRLPRDYGARLLDLHSDSD
ncbi:MAG: hypothetical protein WDO12_13990 [Pseudomonadota bacterium]